MRKVKKDEQDGGYQIKKKKEKKKKSKGISRNWLLERKFDFEAEKLRKQNVD